MSGDRLSVLDEIAQDVAKRGLEPSAALVIQERIEDALTSSTQAQLRELATSLEKIVQELFRQASPKVVAALRRDGTAEPDLLISHSLGAVGFAQALATHSLARRADDGFAHFLSSRMYRPIIDELIAQPLTGVELAERLEARSEVVSRKLKVLRQIGAVDYRKDGTSLVNFLTPAALCLVKDGAGEAERLRPPVIESLEAARSKLKEHLRDQVSWGDGATAN